MFSKVLIANRGAIACRIIRTLRRMGVGSVAVFSDADAGSLHVLQSDEAVRIGPAQAAESYLSIEAVLAAARAVCFRPNSRMFCWVGPMKTTPAASHAWANARFSERKP